MPALSSATSAPYRANQHYPITRCSHGRIFQTEPLPHITHQKVDPASKLLPCHRRSHLPGLTKIHYCSRLWCLTGFGPLELSVEIESKYITPKPPSSFYNPTYNYHEQSANLQYSPLRHKSSVAGLITCRVGKRTRCPARCFGAPFRCLRYERLCCCGLRRWRPEWRWSLWIGCIRLGTIFFLWGGGGGGGESRSPKNSRGDFEKAL